MNCYLGIDVGTSSTKSMLISSDGIAIGNAQENYDIIKKQGNYAEQDMEAIWQATARTLRKLTTQYPKESANIKGISYSGQMHGLVMIDVDRRPVRDAIIWADQRSGEEIEEIYQAIGTENYKEVTMNSLATGFMVSSLMWVKKHEPENFRRIYRVLFPKDYIRYKMCDEIGTDKSDASSGAIFDIKNRIWAWKFMDKLGLDRSLFPACHESGEPAGLVTKRCAEETGLREGIMITYGGGDTLMQGVGNGAAREGILTANIGTSCQIATACKGPLHDAAYRTNTFCHVSKDLWLLMGAHLSGGVALKWLRDQVLDMPSYNAMTTLASKVRPGSEGMVFLPYLNGERTPYNDPEAKGVYLGMNLSHGREHFIRSTMEGIVFCLRSSIEILSEIGVSYNRIIASGGGARSRLFLEMQADIFDCEIYTSSSGEQACVGAAITAAIATGEYKNYEEACSKMVRMSDHIVVPNRKNQKIYEEQYALYKELYNANKDLFHKSSLKRTDG